MLVLAYVIATVLLFYFVWGWMEADAHRKAGYAGSVYKPEPEPFIVKLVFSTLIAATPLALGAAAWYGWRWLT